MIPARLVLVTRRFWPLVGGAERAMAALAAEFRARQMNVTLLTARWEAAWPTQLAFCGVPVIRIPQPSRPQVGHAVVHGASGAWLRRHRGQYDLVYVSMLKHDAAAALCAVRRGTPVVLRAEGAGAGGDCRWQEQAWGGRWIARRCRQAAALVAPGAAIAEELRAAGYAAGRIHAIGNGVSIPPPRTAAARAAAREALGDAQPALGLPGEAILAVYTGRLHAEKGLYYLLKAWRQMVVRHPQARLWLVGEGPQRTALEEQIESLGLWRQVVSGRRLRPGRRNLGGRRSVCAPFLRRRHVAGAVGGHGRRAAHRGQRYPGNRALVTTAARAAGPSTKQ